MVDAERAVVLDPPWLAAVCGADELVTGGDAAALAELLDLPLVSEDISGVVVGPGRPAWGVLVEVVAACAVMGLPVPEGEVVLHDVLQVCVTGTMHQVPWWVTGSGVVHAADPLRALSAPADRLPRGRSRTPGVVITVRRSLSRGRALAWDAADDQWLGRAGGGAESVVAKQICCPGRSTKVV